MAIPIRKVQEIEKIKIPAKLVAKTLKLLKEHTKPGITPIELDKMKKEKLKLKDEAYAMIMEHKKANS